MTRPLTALTLLAALLLLVQATAAAAAADPDEDQPEATANAPWSLSLATLVDQQSTRGFSGELGRELTKNTSLRFAADSTDYVSTNALGVKSQGVEAGASHEFERFGIQGTLAHWQSVDLVTANELRLGGDFHAEPWSAGLRAGYRRAQFDSFTSTADVTLNDGSIVPAGTESTCKLNNSALGLDGRFAGDVWGAFATLMDYHYQDAKCSYLLNGKQTESRVNRQQLVELAGGELDRMSAAATRRIARQETLFEWTFDSGASWKHDDLIVSLDYSRQKEYLKGLVSNTLSATGTADLGDHAGVDLTLGITKGGGVVEGAFVGFAVRAKF